MRRRLALLLAFACIAAAASAPGGPAAGAQETITIRLATLAPRRSAWMRAYTLWDRELRARTGGRVRLRIYAGGSAGGERTVVRKLRANQLDAAAITTTGLGQIVRPALVLSAPGVIRDYPELDAVRRELAPELEAEFDRAGFKLLGWGDAGRVRLFSTRPIRRPADLRRCRPWVWRDNPVFVEFIRAAGVRGVPLAIAEVRPGMQTGRIDTFAASALGAVALQWFTGARYVSRQSSGIVVGAMIMRKDVFDRLPPDVRQTFEDESARNSATLSRAIRRADDRAYRALLSRGLTPVDVEPHRAEWEEVGRRARERLTGRLWSRGLLTRAQAVVARVRSRRRP